MLFLHINIMKKKHGDWQTLIDSLLQKTTAMFAKNQFKVFEHYTKENLKPNKRL